MTTRTLDGTAALITGGGSGIGLGAAAALVADGMSVTIMGRNAEKLDAAAVSLRETAPDGVTVATFAGDVTDEDAVAAAVAAAASMTGTLDACVTSAGDGTLGPVIATSLDEWNRVLGVSLTGTFLTFKHAGAVMGRAGHGSIVAVSSWASATSHRFMAPYCVAKAGVDMLVSTTADELGQVGVRVNSVNPGIIRTDLVAMISPDDTVGQSYIAGTPLGRFGEVDDVAPVIRFLCGPESGFVTGTHIEIDGGNHLRMGPDFGEIATALYGTAAEGVAPTE